MHCEKYILKWAIEHTKIVLHLFIKATTTFETILSTQNQVEPRRIHELLTLYCTDAIG
jgi:hypothetical protein